MRNTGTNECSTCDNFEQCPQLNFSGNVQSGFCVDTQTELNRLLEEKAEEAALSDAASASMEAI